MEMKNFFQKLFTGSRETEVPKVVKLNFEERFSQSINVEWQKVDGQFEAVFYRDDLENIAIFEKDGTMICLKTNLPLTALPENVAQNARKEGELMNAIQIECTGELEFELIVRDESLVRYFLLIDEKGQILKKDKL